MRSVVALLAHEELLFALFGQAQMRDLLRVFEAVVYS